MKLMNVRFNLLPKLSSVYKNPCLDLERYLEVPLFNAKEFSPSLKSLLAADELFVPKVDNKIERFCKTIHADRLPAQNLPEVAFLGRSNAGKSSLIKAIFKNIPNFVKTSKKPGSTKSIHFYQVGAKMCLVDMPGYGFNQPFWFESVVIHYLMHRKNLIKTFVVTDGKVGLQPFDENTLKLLEELKIPYCVIMSKIDKASDSLRLKNFLRFQDYIKEQESINCFPQPFMLSSLTYEGLSYFMAFLGHVTGNLNVHE